MKSRNFLVAVLAACFCLAAGAHAFLDKADPKVGSTVKVAPAELRLWFTEGVEPAFSSVQVLDAQGKRVDTAAVQVDAKDRKLLHVPLTKLGAGAYLAVWRIVSVDTHVSEGRFAFHVAP
jgi:methionine-rich copper-binding protein CopC